MNPILRSPSIPRVSQIGPSFSQLLELCHRNSGFACKTPQSHGAAIGLSSLRTPTLPPPKKRDAGVPVTGTPKPKLKGKAWLGGTARGNGDDRGGGWLTRPGPRCSEQRPPPAGSVMPLAQPGPRPGPRAPATPTERRPRPIRRHRPPVRAAVRLWGGARLRRRRRRAATRRASVGPARPHAHSSRLLPARRGSPVWDPFRRPHFRLARWAGRTATAGGSGDAGRAALRP